MNYEVMTVELKPLDISTYCKGIFGKCSKTLVMSATILDHKAFCRSVGLSPDQVKFIQVQSDFPLEHRPIVSLNIAYLNYNNLQSAEVKYSIARAVDNIMSLHAKDKGIIHTTSYEQLNFRSSINYDFSIMQDTFTPIQGAKNVMYWASHRSNNLMRIYKWNESLTRVESVDEHIPAWSPLIRGNGQCMTNCHLVITRSIQTILGKSFR